MGKKGFTLIELLAVIAILALLGSIIIPIINKDISRSRETLYQQQIKNIETAARQYGASHLGELPSSSSDEDIKITLQTLIDGGYISDGIVNPKTRQKFPNSTPITISYQNGKLIYTVGA